MGNLILLAASNSSDADRSRANFVCSGKNDEQVINSAVNSLTSGGTVQLLDGDYYIDSFPNEGCSAVFFGFNDGQARVVNIIGDTENKSYNTHFGVAIHVTETALASAEPDMPCRVFYGTPSKPDAPGDFYTYTHVNNVNFENFYIFSTMHPVRSSELTVSISGPALYARSVSIPKTTFGIVLCI